MKVKLLKKVRKRFSIIEYPKGMYMGDRLFEGHVFWLQDSFNDWNCQIFSPKDFGSVENAKDEAFKYLKKVIRKVYFRNTVKSKKKPSRKIWHNDNISITEA